MDASSSVQSDDKSNIVINAKSIVTAKTETPQSSQPDVKELAPAVAKIAIVFNPDTAPYGFRVVARIRRDAGRVMGGV